MWWPCLANIRGLRGMLGNSYEGGGPKALQIVADWEAFFSRHADKFYYNASRMRVSLRAPVIDTAAEARVVQRLTARLCDKPEQAAPLQIEYACFWFDYT